jgi:hypothetical protein
MSRRAVISLSFVMAFIFAIMTLIRDLSAGADILVITAKHINKAPAGPEDPIWQEIRPVNVSVEGRENLAGQRGIVSTRAIYTDGSLYFHLKWKDPTRSVIKQSWQFDGKKWHHLKGNEDRIALLFEITRINKFSNRGCAVTCHSPADVPRTDWKFATRTAAEKGDLWHWKAARSDPYNHADDAWLTLAGNPSGSYRETGRRKDAGRGGDVKNQTKDKSKPLYMQDQAKRPSVPGFLLFEETVKINDYTIFKAGDTIPFRLPRKPFGSRFDVKALSRYADGEWTVMLYRKLDTGHEDDVAFNPMKRYSFAMALFDDSGDDHSKATQAMILKFVR